MKIRVLSDLHLECDEPEVIPHAQADLIVLTGSNTAWCHPVLFRRMVEELWVDQVVVEDHVGGRDQLAGPLRQQPRVTRARTDEMDGHRFS